MNKLLKFQDGADLAHKVVDAHKTMEGGYKASQNVSTLFINSLYDDLVLFLRCTETQYFSLTKNLLMQMYSLYCKYQP